jgi:hypothetical protein
VIRAARHPKRRIAPDHRLTRLQAAQDALESPTSPRSARPHHRRYPTPEYVFRPACGVQDALGRRQGAFDLSAACTGFVYALAWRRHRGAMNNVLVIGGAMSPSELSDQDVHPVGDGRARSC